MQHELVNAARVPKAHFGLRRMHVDVDAARIDLEEQQVTGLALAVQHLRVGFARGVRQHPVAHAAAVYEEVLRLGPRLRRSCVPEYAQRAGLRLDRQRGVDEFAAQERSHALTQGLTAQMPAGAAIVLERERDFGARQRDAPEELVAVAEFGGFAASSCAAKPPNSATATSSSGASRWRAPKSPSRSSTMAAPAGICAVSPCVSAWLRSWAANSSTPRCRSRRRPARCAYSGTQDLRRRGPRRSTSSSTAAACATGCWRTPRAKPTRRCCTASASPVTCCSRSEERR